MLFVALDLVGLDLSFSLIPQPQPHPLPLSSSSSSSSSPEHHILRHSLTLKLAALASPSAQKQRHLRQSTALPLRISTVLHRTAGPKQLDSGPPVPAVSLRLQVVGPASDASPALGARTQTQRTSLSDSRRLIRHHRLTPLSAFFARLLSSRLVAFSSSSSSLHFPSLLLRITIVHPPPTSTLATAIVALSYNNC